MVEGLSIPGICSNGIPTTWSALLGLSSSEETSYPHELHQLEIWSRTGSFKKYYQLLHFEWSPPWHHIITYLSQILTFFVLKSGEDEKERIILMKSRALRSLDFIRIILSSSSLLLVGGPAVTTVIYLAKLIQTDSRYAWFETISDARASPDA